MVLTLRGPADAHLRAGALATVAVAAGTVLLGGTPAAAHGDDPEAVGCTRVLTSDPSTLLRSVTTRTDLPDGTSTVELTLSRASTQTEAPVLDCVWVDTEPNGLLDPTETLLQRVSDVAFTVSDGTATGHVIEVVPTGGVGGDPICAVAAVVAPADAPGGSGAAAALRVLETSEVSCAASLVPVVSESSNAAALTGAGLVAVAGGAGWFARSRRARGVRSATTR